MSSSKISKRTSVKLDDQKENDDKIIRNTTINEFKKQISSDIKCNIENLNELYKLLDESEFYDIIANLECIKDIEIKNQSEDII